MANNVFGGGNNPRVLIDDTDIDDMGFTSVNTRKVVKPGVSGNSDQSYVPGSGFNTLTGTILKFTGIDIYTKDAQDRDMTQFVYGGGFGPTVSPATFYLEDNFTGASGPLTAHDPDPGPGDYTTITGAVALDGNGKALFPAGSNVVVSKANAAGWTQQVTADTFTQADTPELQISFGFRSSSQDSILCQANFNIPGNTVVLNTTTYTGGTGNTTQSSSSISITDFTAQQILTASVAKPVGGNPAVVTFTMEGKGTVTANAGVAGGILYSMGVANGTFKASKYVSQELS